MCACVHACHCWCVFLFVREHLNLYFDLILDFEFISRVSAYVVIVIFLSACLSVCGPFPDAVCMFVCD